MKIRFKEQYITAAKTYEKDQPYDVTPYVKFDGFKVKRRAIGPDGVIDGIEKKYADVAGTTPDKNGSQDAGWFVYNYETRYQALIASRSR